MLRPMSTSRPLSILVTGGAGEIGSRLVEGLLQQGHSVRVLVLPDDPQLERVSGLPCEIVTGDITRPASLARACAGIHTVYHLAAVLLVEDPQLFERINVEGVRNVVGAATAAGVEHLIHISSASVVYPRTTHYSRSKRRGEEIVRGARELNTTIVRPTLVYEGEGGLEFKIFSDYLRRCPGLVPLIGDGSCLKSPVHAADLIEGLASIAGNALTHGREYNLCGGETVSLREMARLILQRQGRRRIFVPIPGRSAGARRGSSGIGAPPALVHGAHPRRADPGRGPGPDLRDP